MRIVVLVLITLFAINGCGYKENPVPEAGQESTYPDNPKEEVLF